MPTKPPIEMKLLSKIVIWSVQFLPFNQMILEQPKASLDSISLSSQARNYATYTSCFLQVLRAPFLRAPPVQGKVSQHRLPRPAPDTAPKQDTLRSLPAHRHRDYRKEILPRASTAC